MKHLCLLGLIAVLRSLTVLNNSFVNPAGRKMRVAIALDDQAGIGLGFRF